MEGNHNGLPLRISYGVAECKYDFPPCGKQATSPTLLPKEKGAKDDFPLSPTLFPKEKGARILFPRPLGEGEGEGGFANSYLYSAMISHPAGSKLHPQPFSPRRRELESCSLARWERVRVRADLPIHISIQQCLSYIDSATPIK
jgi:hypothetical protein